MKALSIQDISCYGQCSLTVALPILSYYGIETAILPSAVLSTHTSGFKNFTVLDLTDEMPKIINHWIDEGIHFDVIYTGYIGDVRQFDFILNCVSKLLNEGGIFFVDPAMADHGKLYPALNENIIEGMKLISKKADFIIPNITEACFLTNTEYLENYDKEYIYNLINKLHELGSKNVIITGVSFEKDKLGAVCSNGIDTYEYFGNLQVPSFHGTGDIFSSIVVGNIMNGKTTENSIKTAVDFVIACIKHTKEDINHSYGVKFEELLKTLK